MAQSSAAGYLLDLRFGVGDRHRSLTAGVLLALLICAGTRLVVWTAAYAGAWVNVRITQRIEPPLEMTGGEFNRAVGDSNSKLGGAVRERIFAFQPLLNWDGFHYRSVIEAGYAYEPIPAQRYPNPLAQFNIAFFPLYPMLCALPARWVGAPAAMMLIANLAALAGAAVLFLWLERLCERGSALFGVAVIFGFPSASFLSFGYPESLGLLLVGWMLLTASRRRWWWAALACGLATAARPTLLPAAPLLLMAYLLSSARLDGARWLKAFALGGLSISGAAIYFGYLAFRFGSPFVYQRNFEAGWIGLSDEASGHRFWTMAEVWTGIRPLLEVGRDFPLSLAGAANPMTWNMPLALALVVLSVLWMRRVPLEIRPWLLLAPLIFLQRYLAAGWSGFAMESMLRYVGIAAPTVGLLGVWAAGRSVGLRYVLMVMLLLLQATFAFHFGMNEWAG